MTRPGTTFGPDAPDFLNFDSRNPTGTRDAHAHVVRRRARARARPAAIEPPHLPWWGGADADAWDTITINGYAIVGKVTVTGQGPRKKLDVRSAPGSDGARLVDKGYEPAELDIRFAWWTEQHVDDYRWLVGQAHPRRPGQRVALDVAYPSLAALGITRVVVKSLSPLEPEGTPGVMMCTLAVIEHAPPSAAPARAVAARPSLETAGNALPAPTNAVDVFASPRGTQGDP